MLIILICEISATQYWGCLSLMKHSQCFTKSFKRPSSTRCALKGTVKWLLMIQNSCRGRGDVERTACTRIRKALIQFLTIRGSLFNAIWWRVNESWAKPHKSRGRVKKTPCSVLGIHIQTASLPLASTASNLYQIHSIEPSLPWYEARHIQYLLHE